MRVIVFSAVCVMFVLVSFAAFAGSLDSSAAPDATNSYTLKDLYNRLYMGMDGSQVSFAEPTAMPGVTGYTLNQIMGGAPAKDNTDGATAADVTKDRTFWGLTDGGWGLQTGTYEQEVSTPTCSGTLNGTRWCDNGNGTVTDMSTGLIWLKNANCTDALAGITGGQLSWENALTWSSVMKSGSCGLSDSSVEGDWHLPTKNELVGIMQGNEAISSSEMRAFTAIQSNIYWSSTSFTAFLTYAWHVPLDGALVSPTDKANTYYVWSVRSGQ